MRLAFFLACLFLFDQWNSFLLLYRIFFNQKMAEATRRDEEEKEFQLFSSVGFSDLRMVHVAKSSRFTREAEVGLNG